MSLKVVCALVAATCVCLCVSPASSACFQAYGCFDAATNTTHASGERWVTPSCTRCSCYEHKRIVMSCVEVATDPSPSKKTPYNPFKKNAQKVATLDEQVGHPLLDLWSTERRLSSDQAEDIECPALPKVEGGALPPMKLVTYVTYTKRSDCCTIARPVQIPNDCEAVLDETKCIYSVVDKTSGGPCMSGPISFVGK